MSSLQLKQAALRVALCGGCTIALGFAVFGFRIFNPGLTYSQFVAGGFNLGLFATLAIAARPRWTILAGGLYFAMFSVITRPDSMALLLRNAVYITAVLLAIRICVASDRRLPRIVFGKFIVWAAVFGAAYILSVELLGLLQPGSPSMAIVGLVARTGALMGIGVGLGCELSALILRSNTPEKIHPDGQIRRHP